MGKQTTQSTDGVEFTYSWYREFLNAIREAGYEFRRFPEGADAGTAYLRHDVDLSVADAVTMARLEAEHDVEATYCVLLTSGLYNPLERECREQIREIEALGHEVALHFSTHEYWDAEPDDDDLRARVDEERAVLGTVAAETPEVVSFHVPPEWTLNRSFEGFRNTYAPEYFTGMDYVADSGQRWREAPPNVSELGDSVQILTHPGLWGAADSGFEDRVERAVAGACRRVETRAHREFLGEGAD